MYHIEQIINDKQDTSPIKNQCFQTIKWLSIYFLHNFLEKYNISNYSSMKTMIYHDESSYGTVQKRGKLVLLQKTTLWYNTKNYGTKFKNDCSIQKVKKWL